MVKKKPTLSELLFAAANAAEPFSEQLAAMQNMPAGFQPCLQMSSADYESAKQTARILRALARVHKSYEDANGTSDPL